MTGNDEDVRALFTPAPLTAVASRQPRRSPESQEISHMIAHTSMLRAMRTAAAVSLLTLFAATAGAQTVTGTLFGTVADNSGAVLPGVTVIVASPQPDWRHADPHHQRGRRISGAGVAARRYQIDFELQGFRHVTRHSVQLEAGASMAVDGEARSGQPARDRDRQRLLVDR